MQIDPYVDPKSLSVNNIPSIRFGAGFLTRTFARLLKELVDVAKDIADRQKGVQEKEGGSKDIKVKGILGHRVLVVMGRHGNFISEPFVCSVCLVK